MPTIKADLAVIGAGAVGASCAYHAAKRGLKVALFDARMPTAGTSGACSGLIAISTKKPGLAAELAAETKRLYPKVVAELHDDVEYRPAPLLMLIEDADILTELEVYQDTVRSHGWRLDHLDRAAVLALEPDLSPDFEGALLCPDEATVNPYRMTLGMVAGAVAHGATTHWGVKPSAIDIVGDSIAAIETPAGRIEAEQYVFAAGVWSPDLGAMVGLDLPVVPRRGDVVVTARSAPIVNHYLMAASSMVVKNRPELAETTDDPLMCRGGGFGTHVNALGQCLLGTTRAFGGYDRTTDPEGVRAIVASALKRLPGLARVPILRTFVGLRPHVPDGKPIIGRSGRITNLLVATGHDGDGISLSVVTGDVIADMATGRKPGIDVSALSPDRFPALG